MEKILSVRYAKALLDLAVEEDIVDEAGDDLRAMAGLLREHEELGKFFASPLIDDGAKIKPVKRIMAHSSKLAQNFVCLLAQKGRLSILDEIVDDYERMAAEEMGRATARIETAGPIEDADVEAIRSQLERLAKKKIQTEVRINKSLMAGLRARVGDRVYDGSLLKKLEDLRQVLAG